MNKKGLTPRQKEILDYLKEFIEASGYPPALREICARFKIRGPKNAGKHLMALEKKGFIRRQSNLSRGIDIGPSFRSALSIPIAGSVKAGPLHLAVEEITGYVTLDASFFRCKDAFILKAEGRSMTGAGIDDGDYLVVRPGKDATDNDIVVAMLEGEATVKRFFREGSIVILKPENPDMEPIRVAGGEFSIIGKVISIIKRLE